MTAKQTAHNHATKIKAAEHTRSVAEILTAEFGKDKVSVRGGTFSDVLPFVGRITSIETLTITFNYRASKRYRWPPTRQWLNDMRARSEEREKRVKKTWDLLRANGLGNPDWGYNNPDHGRALDGHREIKIEHLSR